MWLLYLLFWTAVRASKPHYGKLHGVAVLTPDHVGVHITDITWKHGSVVAMEWHGTGKGSSHGNFQGRALLDTGTGEMTIETLTKGDDGIYTATINTNLTSQTKLLVISPVPKPSISVKCDTTTCTFNCEAKLTDAGPVTYWWKADYRRWTSTSRQRITKEDKEEWFSCIVENPVSSHRSDEIFNPFLPSSKTWIYILVAVILAVGILGFLGYKYKTK
ncbi:CD48 antigen-like isoform X1 [Scomber japonicus]|uniref:CD48 antigen-like isoform X1 n=1 Tax=Scomber japonicus TaxID=13676 RepID=UPI002306D80E|nr:CD48 antigen-like isoform X1 [Scomber japonicus]XP_053170667.1 CD48 antigen-like isoform X1 [Scomber japonicus]